jgi:hypothetical protein
MAHGINMAERFEGVVRDVLERPTLPTATLINGDLAFNTGETADYGAFAQLVMPLRATGIPLHLALGNHDHRTRFWSALETDKSVVPPLVDRQVALLRADRVNWLMLDSLDKTMSTPGVLGNAQLDWLARTLDAEPRKPAIVMVHHNPTPAGAKPSLVDTERFMSILRPRRQVKAYFFGHTHRWSVTRDESGLHLVNLPTTAYLFDNNKAGASGWVMAALGTQGVRLEFQSIDRAHPEHGRVYDLAWRS